MALILKRQYELAASHLERAISLNPANATAMAYHAELFLRNGDFALALKTMDELLQRDPIPATWHWEIRGMALLMLRQYQEAILAFSRQAHPFWYIHGYLAMCQARLGHLGEAKAEIEKLRQEYPGPAAALAVASSRERRRDPVLGGVSSRRSAGFAPYSAGVLSSAGAAFRPKRWTTKRPAFWPGTSIRV
ncbi:tetratricopeptide repeat protein [Mesorhizobium sp. M0015]